MDIYNNFRRITLIVILSTSAIFTNASNVQVNADQTRKENNKGKNIKGALTNEYPSITELKAGFENPRKKYYPETWFHLNGKNISKAGLSADLEAIYLSGMQGIQVFNKRGPAYPDVPQISILTPQWEDAIAHIADETERLGLNLTFQNCPGWSMAGGPWVPVEEAQRELIHHEFHFSGNQGIQEQLDISIDYQTADRNYQDVKVLAFKTPVDHTQVDHTPVAYHSNNTFVPWPSIFDKNKRTSYQIKPKKQHNEETFRSYQEQGIQPVSGEPTWVEVTFDTPITLRSVELPPVRNIFMDRQYPKTNIDILLEAKVDDNWQVITRLRVPTTHWYDDQYSATLAVPETRSLSFRLTFEKDPLFFEYVKLHSRAYLHNHQAKASKSSRHLQSDIVQKVDLKTVIDMQQVQDISSFMDANGVLTWDAPLGDWTVIRFGHVNMLRTNRPAEPEATGWESSKLDKKAIENHLRKGMMGNLMRAGGPLEGHKVYGMLIDSWESYVPTWTMKQERLSQEFKKRRGYDMTSYLPATLGYIVDSVEVSNKFLRDLRETMDDLYVENFFEHFRTVAHDMGSQVYTEGAVGETLPGDPLRYYGVSDFPMTEFWYPKAPSNQKEAKPIFAAASAYHLYNKEFLAAEAATQLQVKWNESPQNIQYLINENFAKGVNHLVFHTFSHTPQVDVLPGSSFGGQIGFPLLRTQTWWRHTPAWMKSLARAQYVLQQGEFVADVLWYLGDELDRHPFDTEPFPVGYKFDYLNAEILHSKVKVTNGQLHVEDAGEYKVIMLRDSQRMLLSTARKLKKLVLKGAIILGNKPIDSPSLMDNAQSLAELKRISDELWGESQSGVSKVGQGKVYWGYDLAHVLAEENIQADVTTPNATNVRWLHRSTPDAEIYYVSNQHDVALDVSVQFREGQGRPEIWDLKTGDTYSAQLLSRELGSSTSSVLLQLNPHASQFVVFNKHIAPKNEFQHLASSGKILLNSKPLWYRLHKGDSAPIQLRNNQLEVNSSGNFTLVNDSKNQVLDINIVRNQQSLNDIDWELSFEQGWDTPATLTMAQLQALHLNDVASVRHYSGTVEYKAEFDIEHSIGQPNDHLTIIDLGDVYDIAELWLNGHKVGTRLAPPYKFDVSEHLMQRNNNIQIVVSNTWRNQLIFDNQRAKEDKKTWTTNPPKHHETTLEPSGIAGPVSLFTIHFDQYHIGEF